MPSQLRYLSVCSGIEAASLAWGPLGWQPRAFAEIEPFPCELLAQRFPGVPNLGDMTQHHTWHEHTGPIDILVGGTPCQAFSVAGLREGLADPRGNLTLTYLAIAAQYRPTWLVWENVPGVLSDETDAFGCFTRGLAELGYGWAYRVLDAQYFGVAQRRRRVFVVASLAGWAAAAAVLFEPESLRRDSAPRRGQRQTIAGGFEVGPGGGSPIDIAPTLDASHDRKWGSNQWVDNGFAIVEPSAYARNGGFGQYNETSHAAAVCASGGDIGRGSETLIAFPQRLSATQCASAENISPAIQAINPTAIAFSGRARGDDGRGYERAPQVFGDGPCGALDTVKPHCVAYPDAAHRYTVRRLTPMECERLQGFPDNYTQIAYGKKKREDCPDGPRYKAIGNSMAVPVMRWIGQRIAMVNKLLE